MQLAWYKSDLMYKWNTCWAVASIYVYIDIQLYDSWTGSCVFCFISLVHVLRYNMGSCGIARCISVAFVHACRMAQYHMLI